QGCGLARDRQPLERLRLDLADALARHAERAADLLERLRVWIAVQAVAQLENVALPLREVLECPVQRLLLEAHVHLFLRTRARGCDQVAESRALVLADRLVEARDRPRRLAHLAHLLQRQLGRLRSLLVGRVALELRRELPRRAADLLL